MTPNSLAQAYPPAAAAFPSLRYMGSKRRLLPWLHGVLSGLDFESALDAFSGSGCVAFLMKAMGKRVVANDVLRFAHQISAAVIENPGYRLTPRQSEALLSGAVRPGGFIERTFQGIFFTRDDLRFLDGLWDRLHRLPTRYHRALVLAAAMRACIKRQPRGVFTVAGDPERYKDGRRDLALPLRTLFVESLEAYSGCVGVGQPGRAIRGDALTARFGRLDLAYLDPPYVPRSDDNCYIKRYHFLEGLATRWRGPEAQIQAGSKVHKLAKRFTPFAYRHTALAAFESLFSRLGDSILVLSYSSNAYPDLPVLVAMMERLGRRVTVHERAHRYHFGTHGGVAPDRQCVREYLIVGDRPSRPSLRSIRGIPW